MVLWTSKTHTLADPPQIISFYCTCHIISAAYCPYEIVDQYSILRRQFESPEEQFFVFRDGTPVTPMHFRDTLRLIFDNANISSQDFCGHSFRAGHANDMKHMKRPVDEIKFKGRWKSNAVFRYFREV